MFENHPKYRIWIFEFCHFQPIFVLSELICLVTLFDRKLQIFKKIDHFWHFEQTFLSTQNVNVARFARKIE